MNTDPFVVTDLSRLGTGVDALDVVLGGGFPTHSTTIVSGEPGTGKTVLMLQILFHLAQQGKKCLYFTTVSEPAIKLIRHMQLFSFFRKGRLSRPRHFHSEGAHRRAFHRTENIRDLRPGGVSGRTAEAPAWRVDGCPGSRLRAVRIDQVRPSMTLSVETTDGTFVRALTDITYALAYAEQPEARIQRVLELLREMLEYEYCAGLIDAMPQGPLFATVSTSQPDADRLRVRLHRLFETVSDRPSQWNTEPYRLPDTLSVGLWSLAVPLVTVDAIVGILQVGRNTEEFTVHEVRLLTLVASQLAGYARGQQFLEQAKRARGQAEQASRAKDRFLATLSHELRTPLNVVHGWLQILRGDATSEATIQKAITVIERNVLTQVQLVEQLLDAARIATGKLHINVQPIEILPVISAAIDSLRPIAQEKGVELDDVLPSPCPWVIEGDPVRLQQAFANLLVNAVKFTPPGGYVRVSAGEDESYVEIEVRDTGIGVDAEHLPKLFEPLWQADGAFTPAAESGLGLGLFIVRNIVQLHGGEVRAESDGPSRGTAVTLRLPLQRGNRHETL